MKTIETEAPKWIESLASEGLAIVDDLLSLEECAAVREEIDTEESTFRNAGIGKAGGPAVNSEVRRDRTKWWDEASLTARQDQLWKIFGSVKEICNRELYLGLRELEGHYAIYETGAFYREHLDRFRSDDRRTLSLVFFFNENWKVEDGGALRVRTKSGEEKRILPEAGRLVIFLSSEIPHEVEVTHRRRYSFAGWWKTS